MTRLLLALLFTLNSYAALASFPDTAAVYLVDAQQQETKIADVRFIKTQNGSTAVKVDLDTSRFTEHFLSMRPFRCIEGETEWFCYLSYPYDLRSLITEDDLSDLEYQLLFIRKTPSEFGIDAWNGLYYQLTLEDDGTITGTLLEGDLNSLQSPPAVKYAKPIDLNEFIDADMSRRLFPALRIY